MSEFFFSFLAVRNTHSLSVRCSLHTTQPERAHAPTPSSHRPLHAILSHYRNILVAGLEVLERTLNGIATRVHSALTLSFMRDRRHGSPHMVWHTSSPARAPSTCPRMLPGPERSSPRGRSCGRSHFTRTNPLKSPFAARCLDLQRRRCVVVRHKETDREGS